MTEQIAIAVRLVAEKKRLPEIHQYTVEINRLENEADRVHFGALTRLVEERSDWFELFRWKEIIEIMEDATDSCEDVADVLGNVVILELGPLIVVIVLAVAPRFTQGSA